MDLLFFRNVVLLASDMHEGKLKAQSAMSAFGALGSIFALQEASDSALVWLPSLSFLGGLRWWVPWKVQQGISTLWSLSGGRKDGLTEAYSLKREWERLTQTKNA